MFTPPGRNRPHKIGLFPTEEQAQEVADRINALIDKQLQKVVEAAREVCDCWDVKEHEECDEHAMQDAIDALRPLVFNDSS